FLFFAGRSLFVIVEVGLTAKCQIAEAFEIRLQSFRAIVVLLGLGIRRFGLRGSGFLLLDFGFGNGDSSHVLRMAIKVMSSFCGCAPTKLRSSSINLLIMTGAPSRALARMDSIIRSGPNSSPFASSASVTPSV